ncbi:MAG: hypothetical protein MK066_12180 [Crocinitomicaceae bacterium]|nr:hypothetical protein [Crocinitomicaceae bacterium]
MPPSRNTSYAEREKHRQEFYARHKNLKKTNKSSSNGIFSFSKKNQDFVAPLALIAFSFTILFSISWVLTRVSKDIITTSIPSGHNALGVLGKLKKGTIYEFNVNQTLEGAEIPEYSELEIEILDENSEHIYSVYKNLWEEMHPNDEGYTRIYSDFEVNFELDFQKGGDYYLRAVSHNSNLGRIMCSVKAKKFGGHLYFGFYAIVFGAFSLGIILGRDSWGSPSQLMNALPKINQLKSNKLFLVLAGVSTCIFVVSVVISMTHYGYASAGEQNIAPSCFYSKGEVIYLG